MVGLQIVLPVTLLLWLLLSPAKDALSYLVRAITTALYFIALCLVPTWLEIPWWTPWIYVTAIVASVLSHVLFNKIPVRHRLPQGPGPKIVVIVVVLCATGLSAVIYQALSGRVVSHTVVDIAFPMGAGTYLVANGGSTLTVNAHLKTLVPTTDRQRAYHGQSYGVDLIKLGDLGLRATQWRPRDPSEYVIYAEPVLAPCAGKVLAALDGKPDMPVPEMDISLLEGNHVFLSCGDYGVLLAHFRRGSLRVTVGDDIKTGDRLAEVGNSGQTGEPHLHVHAQRIPASGPLLSGAPLFITFDGRFPVRNQRVHISSGT
jgi:hypothetical protein